MSDKWWLVDERTEIQRYPRLDPRERPHTIPSSNIEDGADKRRLCVSAEWVKHIVGVLDRLTRSDAWIGTEAEIQNARSNVERMMVQLSEQHTDCFETIVIVNEVIKTVTEYVGGSVDIGEDDMACLSMPDMLKIENGILYGRNSCCEWEVIGQIQSANDITPSTDENPATGTPAEPEVWAPCGKISGLVAAILGMLDACETSYAVPGDFIAAVRAAVPYVEMGRTALLLLWVDYKSFRTIYSYNTLVNPLMAQLMQCKGVAGMQDNGEVSYEEYEFAVNSIRSAIYDTYDIATALAVWTVWEQCYQVIGLEDTRLVMQLGAFNLTGDCDSCDEATGAVPVGDWDFWYDLQADPNGWAAVATNGVWTAGKGWGAITGTGAQGEIESPDRPGGEYAGEIKYVEIEFVADTGDVVAWQTYTGMIYRDGVAGDVTLLGSILPWGGGTFNAETYPSLAYGANTGQKIRFALRLENQATVGWWIRRIRVVGDGEPFMAAPIVSVI